MYVRYLPNGSIEIFGSSDDRARVLIRKLTLEIGEYSFSGLSDVLENTVAIELEFFSDGVDYFTLLTPDVGFVDEAQLKLTNDMRIRAFVGV